MNKLINKIKEPRPREILGELDDIVEDIVAAAFQEIVKPLKKQEKFGREQKEMAKETAIQQVYNSKKAINLINQLGRSQKGIERKIEKFVRKMN